MMSYLMRSSDPVKTAAPKLVLIFVMGTASRTKPVHNLQSGRNPWNLNDWLAYSHFNFFGFHRLPMFLSKCTKPQKHPELCGFRRAEKYISAITISVSSN
jgi:hypothetical protein